MIVRSGNCIVDFATGFRMRLDIHEKEIKVSHAANNIKPFTFCFKNDEDIPERFEFLLRCYLEEQGKDSYINIETMEMELVLK
jgi:hypothetical protein